MLNLLLLNKVSPDEATIIGLAFVIVFLISSSLYFKFGLEPMLELVAKTDIFLSGFVLFFLFAVLPIVVIFAVEVGITILIL